MLYLVLIVLDSFSELHVKTEFVSENRLGILEWRSRLFLVRLPMDRILMMMVFGHWHSSSETHEKILEISPGRFTHRLAVRTFKAGQTGDKLSVALAQLVTTAVSSCPVSNTVGSPSVTFPLVRDEVGEVVLEEHAGGRGVAPVVHLTAPVYTVHSLARAKKATVAAVSLVDQGITACPTLDHGVEVPRGSLARVVLLSFKFGLLKYVVLMIGRHEGNFWKFINSDNASVIWNFIFCG